MSKAEDLSKQYRGFREQCGIKDPVMLNEIEEAYFEGYRQARKAVEIAREEMIEKAQDWIADTFKYDGSEDFNGGDNDAMSMLLDDFTEYIKQAMKDE
jgi:hypothetical protein